MTMMLTKECSACNQVKPVGQFRANRHQCRKCASRILAQWRRDNPEKEKEARKKQYDRRKASGAEAKYMEKYRADNREKLLADALVRTKAWIIANPEKYAAWRDANKDRIQETRRNYTLKNQEHLREGSRKYCADNRMKMREKGRRSYAKNPELAKSHSIKRRIRMQYQSSVAHVDYKEILARDGSFCYLCQKPITDGKIHYDHVVPLAKGGAHSQENIKVTHPNCNLTKHDKSVEEWKAIYAR